MPNPVTKKQIQVIHILLNRLNLMSDKKELINSYTHFRTGSSREMFYFEAEELIERLAKGDPLQKMRKKVFALARKMQMIWGYDEDDLKMNIAKINAFLRNRGAVKKPLNQLNIKELNRVVTQFEIMANNKKYRQFIEFKPYLNIN